MLKKYPCTVLSHYTRYYLGVKFKLSDDHLPNCDAILLTVPHRYSCRRWHTRFWLIHMPYDFWSYKPTWAQTLSTTPRSSGHSPRRGRTELICSERQLGIAVGNPAGQISVVSTTILYSSTRNSLCGSPGCGCGARWVQGRHSEVLTFLVAC